MTVLILLAMLGGVLIAFAEACRRFRTERAAWRRERGWMRDELRQFREWAARQRGRET